jgi:hypothetical protein
MYNEFDTPDTSLEKILSIFDDFVYSIHFLVILASRSKIYQVEKESLPVMMMHFLAG